MDRRLQRAPQQLRIQIYAVCVCVLGGGGGLLKFRRVQDQLIRAAVEKCE